MNLYYNLFFLIMIRFFTCPVEEFFTTTYIPLKLDPKRVISRSDLNNCTNEKARILFIGQKLNYDSTCF